MERQTDRQTDMLNWQIDTRKKTNKHDHSVKSYVKKYRHRLIYDNICTHKITAFVS